MDSLLVKIFATALTFSQVTVGPETIKTQFDPIQDQHEVVALLRAGCAHMRKAFDIEDINIDDLIATAMDDPEAMTGGIPQFKGISLKDLHVAYKQFCKNETVENSPVDIAHIIEFYNRTVEKLPDHARLKGLRLPGISKILDLKGEAFTEVFEQDHRRVWIPLSEIPPHVQNAFIAAEDKRFRQHKGIDERGLIRAFLGNLAQSGRPQGGSTITQQVVKNLLVGDDVSYERKMREMIVAARAERILSKDEILELYLNSAYLGRGAWGIEMAARSYFGKRAKELTLAEGALLAGLTKGPNYFNPDRHPQRAQQRFAYVLGRMSEDGMIGADEAKQATARRPELVVYERPRRDTGYHFVDHIAREAKALAGIGALTSRSYAVRSTLHPQLQRATEAALQEGLARYEINTGRARFHGAEANLGDSIRRIERAPAAPDGKPAWQRALEAARLPLYDVHWPAAIVLEPGGGGVKVGLADGRVVPLSGTRSTALRNLKLHDVVYVRVIEAAARAGKGRAQKGAPKSQRAARAELRVRPTVQGTAVVLDNRTGRILAMAGGFSYPLSQLNRATQSQRQPGSALKPVTYLAVLARGLQPNTLVRDEPLTLSPITTDGRYARQEDYWSPKNYDGGASGVITLRRAIELSRNLATANLLQGGIDVTPTLSLDRVCALAVEAQIYKECSRYYPFVLGAQAVRPIDLAAFFAAIANEGVRPAPYVIESVEDDGNVVYRHEPANARIGSADRVAFYQLKTMLQGVLMRGTAARLAALAPYVAGKTGTTDGENDAWFVGFTNEVTVAVWVGYDNADGRRRTLGGGQTGASVAIPIFEPIIQAAWANYAPRTRLSGPSAEARRFLVARRVDRTSGDTIELGGQSGQAVQGGLIEYLRRDRNGQPIDTQYRLVSRAEAYSANDPYRDGYRNDGFFSFFGGRGFAPWTNAPPPRQPWGGWSGGGSQQRDNRPFWERE
ncbi:MAG: penicillin-binding protein 1A [Xanthobacteraceae bacterium]